MDSLRLPPLRFSNQKCSGELNCVLPPITPPPNRLSPSNNNIPWQHSPAIPSALPSPATISPATATDIPNFPRPHIPEDATFSPITHTPPSTIRPLPPPSVLPAAGTMQPHSNIQPSSQYVSPRNYPSHADAYPFPPPAQLAATHPVPEPFPRQYQSYAPVSASPVVPWRQGSNLPGPAPIPGPLQRSAPGYSEIARGPFQMQPAPTSHGQVMGPSAQPVRTMQPAAGYYSDGTPIQRVGTIEQQAIVVRSAGASSSQQPQQQLPMDVKSPLKKTVNTARGVRDVYACPYPNCERVSTEQSNMKAHMRMHTGEKPYVCRNAGCMKAFRWKSSLTYHEKALHVKSRPFKCSPCRRSFVEKRKLRMHFDLCPVIRRHREQGDRGDEAGMQ